MIPTLKKRILVAGGAGFLGTNLCVALLKEGHEVTVLDNFSKGRRANLDHLEDFGDLQVLEQDIADPINIHVDEIYNLTSGGLPGKQQHVSAPAFFNRTTGVSNLITLAHRNRARVMQLSNDQIFTSGEMQRYAANDFDDVDTLDVDIRTARIFNPYGPFMPTLGGRVVSNFIVQALLNRPLTIYGDGNQTRSFCYVDDLISGLRALMEAPHNIVGPIDLGSAPDCPVFELAQKIIALVGSSSTVVFQPPSEKDSWSRRPDLERAKQLLGWEPSVSLEEGLIRTITYFEGVLHSNTAFAAALANNHFSFNRQNAGAGETAR